MRNLLLFLFASACTFARTQTIVELRADGRVTGEATEIRVEVRSQAGAEIFARTLATQTSELIQNPDHEVFRVRAKRTNVGTETYLVSTQKGDRDRDCFAYGYQLVGDSVMLDP